MVDVNWVVSPAAVASDGRPAGAWPLDRAFGGHLARPCICHLAAATDAKWVASGPLAPSPAYGAPGACSPVESCCASGVSEPPLFRMPNPPLVESTQRAQLTPCEPNRSSIWVW